MEQDHKIKSHEELNDIIIEQESTELNHNNTSKLNSNSSLMSDKISLESFLFKNGIFLPENKFIGEIYFKKEALKDIESYMEDVLSTAFKEENLNFVVINATFFRKNTEYRKIIHSYIDEKHPKFKSISVGFKDYLMICKKNKFLEFIQTVPKDEIQGALDLIFLKLFSFNMKENNQDFLDKEELKELNEECEEDNDNYEELQKKKIKRLKEIADEEERKKYISLPVFKKCQIYDIKDTSLGIKLPLIKIDSIIEKNRSNIRGFKRIYENTKIYYVAYLYDSNSKEFKEHVVSENPSFIISHLNSNSAYLVRFSLKFDKYYSKPSKSFIFYTRRLEFIDHNSVISYVTWGNNKNNRLLVNSDYIDGKPEDYIDIKDSKSSDDRLNKSINENSSELQINSEDTNHLNQPSRLNNNKVIDYTSYVDVTYLLLSTGEVVSSGKTFALSSKISEEVIFDFDESKAEECRLLYTNPYSVTLPWGVHVRKLGCGFDFCVCLDEQGNLYSWGINDFGQLGQNLPKDVVINTPKKINIKYDNFEDNVYVTDIQVGSKHCLASVFTNEKIKLFSWGFGQGCEPILKPEDCAMKGNKIDERLFKISNSFSPLMVKFTNTEKIVKIIAAFNQNAIICREKYLDDKSLDVVYTFGETINLQLGYLHNFIGSVHYWGIPTKIELDHGLSVIDVAYSDNHSLFLVNNLNTNKNEVYCCGINSNNKCGMKGKEIPLPTRINLDLVDSDLQINPIKISAGKNHSLILTDDNRLYLIGKKDICGNNIPNNFISQVDDLKLKNTDKILKFDCMDDNITLLIKHKLN